jgi:hypothetical protein
MPVAGAGLMEWSGCNTGSSYRTCVHIQKPDTH